MASTRDRLDIWRTRRGILDAMARAIPDGARYDEKILNERPLGTDGGDGGDSFQYTDRPGFEDYVRYRWGWPGLRSARRKKP